MFKDWLIYSLSVEMNVHEFQEPLYRADVPMLIRGYRLPVRADEIYGDFNKYFTLTSVETAPYQRRGEQQMYVYTWNPTRPLQLLNMFDLETRNQIFHTAPEDVRNSLNIAFPIRNGSVVRYSDGESVDDDNRCFQHICSLGYHGYIVRQRDERNTFHSEIGVCANALQYLEMDEQPVKGSEPPQISTLSRSLTRLNGSIKPSRLFGGRRYTRRTKKRSRRTRRR